jgi:hypothetical protein
MVMKDYIQADKVPEGPKTVAEDRWNDRLAPAKVQKCFKTLRHLKDGKVIPQAEKQFGFPH